MAPAQQKCLFPSLGAKMTQTLTPATLPSKPTDLDVSKPTDLDVKVRSDKSLEIRWQGVGEHYELEIRYFEFDGPMIQPDHSTVLEVKDRKAAHVLHPESLSKAVAWVVKVSLKAKSGLKCSDAIIKQVSWDDELSTEETQTRLRDGLDDLEKKELKAFTDVKGKPMLLVLGMQHHGKSSFLNHLYRCLTRDLTLNDQMDVASAGADEKTLVTKSLTVSLKTSDVTFIDTPAFANMNTETAGRLRTLLSTGIQDDTRRDDLNQNETSWFFKPPHGAIVVMSLCHWRDQTDEMQSYLEKMAKTFKQASGGKVAFPYVVACTHRDVFLMECQNEDPAKELQKAVDGIKKAALTDHVYSITNYKKDGVESVHNNKATFDLLSQLLTKAKHENTAKVQESGILRNPVGCCKSIWYSIVISIVGSPKHFLVWFAGLWGLVLSSEPSLTR